MGLYLLYAGHVGIGEPIAVVSSFLLFGTMALFGVIVFRATRGAA